MKALLKKVNYFIDDIIIDVIGGALEAVYGLLFDLFLGGHMKRINAVSVILFIAALLNIAAFLIHHGAANLCAACFCAAAGSAGLRGRLKRR